MKKPDDRNPFRMAMMRLSTAFSTELSDLRLETYWDALADISLEGVEFACKHATRWWTPQPSERFPTPMTLREYARLYREQQLQHAAASASHQLAQWSETPDEAGLNAIREVLKLLSKGMDLSEKLDVYREPLPDKPEVVEDRKAKLRDQIRQLEAEEQAARNGMTEVRHDAAQ